jgi:hypothetical protein
VATGPGTAPPPAASKATSEPDSYLRVDTTAGALSTDLAVDARPPLPGRRRPGRPGRGHLAQAIAPGTLLHTSARLRMRGSIKVGRWLPFRARQVLSPHHGFVWSARAAGLIGGTDRYIDGAGAMAWKLAGLVTAAAGEGPGTSRSAAGRAGAEGIWLPTALLPRFGGQIAGDASFGGLTIPAAGRLGRGWGGDGWERGEFFSYRITALEPSGAEPPARSR